MSRSAPANLAACLTSAADRYADRLAVSDPEGETLTYGELAARSAAFAGFLRSRGVGPGHRVGLLLPKSLDAVVAIFGVLRSGAAYVPVDAASPRSRAATILSDAAVTVLVLDGGDIPILDEIEEDRRPATVVVVGPLGAADGSADAETVAWDAALTHAPIGADEPEPTGEDLACLLFTSGSTGRPKGVMISHGNAMSFVDWASDLARPTPDDRFSSHAPFHFDLSVFDLYVCLRHGASLHLIPDALGKDPRSLGAYIAERDISVWYSTPSVLTVLARFGKLEQLDYGGPRLALFAGEVFPPVHLRAITRLWANAAWYNLYGPTETNVCTFAPIPTPVPEERVDPYPIGEACAHCRAVVLDDAGHQVTAGGEGTLHIAGPAVFQGYWELPDRTREAFREIDSERFYDTGDMVRVDPAEGLVFVGRRDRMVKRRGFRVELGEIESALHRHPELTAAAVVAETDPEAGVRITAFVVPEGPPPSIVDLKVYCGRELPSYMSPDVFVVLDALPQTSTDKTDYQALRAASVAGGAG